MPCRIFDAIGFNPIHLRYVSYANKRAGYVYVFRLLLFGTFMSVCLHIHHRCPSVFLAL